MQKRRAGLILGGGAAIAVLWTFFLRWDQLGFQATLITHLFIILFIAVLGAEWKALRRYHKALLYLSSLVSLTFMFRDSGFLAFLAIISILTAFMTIHVTRIHGNDPDPEELAFGAGLYPLVSSFNFESIKVVLSSLRPSKKKKSAEQKSSSAAVVRGILISLPILFVFMALFASADQVFGDAVSGLFTVDFELRELYWRGVFAVILTFVISGQYSNMFSKKPLRLAMPQFKKSAKHATEVSTVLIAVNLLFLSFIVVQAVYLFGSRAYVIDDQALSFAEYGRSGFFELLWVAALVFGLLFIARWFYNWKKFELPGYLSIALIAQTGVVMLSAWRRLSLYEDEFGLTELRFYSMAFILFLAIVFLWLGVTIVKGLPSQRFVQGTTILSLLAVLSLGLFNPDAFIAQRNIDRGVDREAGSAKEIDSFYIFYSLSTDALEQKKQLAEQLNGEQWPCDAYPSGVKEEDFLEQISHFDVSRRANAEFIRSSCQ